MSELIAGAYVRVQAELIKGFRKNLQDQIKTGIGSKPFIAPVKLDVKAFRGEIQRELRKTPFGIPVRPEMSITKFREELRTKVKQASKGVTVTVPVLVGGRTGGTGGTGGSGGLGGGTGGLGGKQKQAAEVIAATSAQKLYTDALTKSATAEQRSERLSLALADAKRGIRASLLSENTAVEGRLRLLQQEIIGEQRLLAQSAATESIQQRLARTRKAASSALAVEISQVTSRSRLGELDNQIKRVDLELRRAVDAATKAGITGLRIQNKELREELALRRTAIAARRDELRTQGIQRTRQAQGIRGAGATGLGLLGVRGATLAAGGPFLIGAAATAISAKTIQAAASLEQELNVLRITARATSEQMEEVSRASIQLGSDISLPAVTATDAAVAMNQLVRAGLSVEDAIAGSRGVLQLATAAQIDFETATNLTASALNAFKLEGADATHVADVFTNAANASQASIEEMGISLQQSAAAAAITGISFEDTVALLTLLSQAGLKGSDAGTSLRTALIRLVNPTKEAAGVIKQLGLDVRDSQGAIRPEVFGEFATATANLSREQRQQAAAIIFGADAFRTIAITSREGVAGLRAVQDQLDRTGSAAELAGARAQGFSGKVSALQSNLQTLGTTLGTGVIPVLNPVVDFFTKLAIGINDTIVNIDKLIAKIGELDKEFSEEIPGGEKVSKGFRDALTFSLTDAAGEVDKFVKGPLRSEIFEQPFDGLEKKAVTARLAVLSVFAAIGEGPGSGTTAKVQATINQLDQIADSLRGGDQAAQDFRKEILDLIQEMRRTGKIPIDIETRFDPSQTKKTGIEAGIQSGLSVAAGMKSAFPQIAASAIEMMNVFGDAAKKQIKTLDLGGAVAQELSLSTKLAVAQATGTEAEQLAILRQQRADALTRLRRNQGRTDLTPAQREAQVKQAAQDVKAADDAIQAILDGRTRDAEAAARDAESAAKEAQTAREKLDEAALAVFDVNRQKAQNKITIASATEGVDDDIRATAFLKRLVKLQISRLKERVKTAEIRNEAFRELSQILFGLDQELQALRRDRRATMRDQVRQGIALDIEFAETTENASLERTARNRMIKSLQAEAKLLQAVKKKSIEQKNRLKEIRNEIAAQRKELQDISRERSRMFQEMSFAFLTTQQGFAANLLGNLLPMGAIGGTVAGKLAGGGATTSTSSTGSSSNIGRPNDFLQQAREEGGGVGRSPGFAVAEASRVGAASTPGGFTNAQVGVLIGLTRQIVRLLGGIDQKGKHPESKQQSKMTSGSFDNIPS